MKNLELYNLQICLIWIHPNDPDYTHLLYIIVTNAYTSIMDMYTIGRMLRSYSVERNNYSKERARNIIFYGGDMHSMHITSILMHFGAKQIGPSIQLHDKSCISINVKRVFRESMQE